MLDEGLLGGHGLLEAGEVVVGADPGRGQRTRERVMLKVGLPVEVVVVGLVGLDLLLRRVGRASVADLALELDAVLHLDRRDRLLGAGADLLALLEQRVLEQLVADQVLEFDAGQLQEFDGLLQLRGHHELLGHPQLLAHVQDHGV
ncbi:MAG: hypothetical protein R6X02_17055 [Enhygromyxa sp.]